LFIRILREVQTRADGITRLQLLTSAVNLIPPELTCTSSLVSIPFSPRNVCVTSLTVRSMSLL
jgi:hypothetical protein